MNPEGIESRVGSLETQVRQLTERVRISEQDAAAARVLAGAADRDVADLGGELRDFRRATMASFNALREDMVDLRTEMAELNNRFTELDNRFTELDNRFTVLSGHVDNGFIAVRGMLDAVAAGQQRIVELIEAHGAGH